MADDVVVITGSNGFLGSALARRLAARHTVVGLDRPGGRAPAELAASIGVDLTDDASVVAAAAELERRFGTRIASVVHLAAYYSFDGDPDPRYQSVNVDGTARLLRALAGFDVDQFVYASTMLVHAPTEPGRPLDAAAPLAPAWAYPQSKLEAEQCIARERGAIPAVILRLAGVYHDEGGLPALAQHVQREYERRAIGRVYPGDPDHGQAALHLDDLLDLFTRVVDRRGALPPMTTLVAGESDTMTYGELQRALGELLHGEARPLTRIPKLVAKTGAWLQEAALPEEHEPFIKHWMVDIADDHYELDPGAARKLFGWEPRHRLRDTLPRIVAALHRDPRAWYRANRLDYREGPPEDRYLIQMHQRTLWPHYVNAALGLWLITAPFVLGYLSEFEPDSNALRVAAARDLAPFAARNLWMTVSDVASGLLVLVFGLLAADPRRRFAWTQWAASTVGLWLLFAPLVFWTPLPDAYANGTLVGMLVIAFSVLVPSMPGMSVRGMTGGPDIPPGWTNCPSTYVQRLPIVALALVGLLISRYLAAFQLGHLDRAWDPFFIPGTEGVITSDVSHAWPWADAGIGAVAYAVEVLMGVMGDKRRWRTMPWMVLGFGVLIVPLGGVSIFFIVIQPVVIGTWCTLCLVAAIAMVVMIPYSLDELVASGQFLFDARRRGIPLWRAFWLGDRMDGGSADDSRGLAAGPVGILREMSKGVTWPWSLVASAAIGVWLMFTRLVFDSDGALADADHVLGALLVTVSITACAEVTRALRFVNVALGACLVLAPFVLDGAGGTAAVVNGVVSGLAVAALALPRGALRQRYGAWQRLIV